MTTVGGNSDAASGDTSTVTGGHNESLSTQYDTQVGNTVFTP